MHLHALGIFSELADADLEWVHRAVVDDGALIAGGFSEPRTGGNWWQSTTHAIAAPGGYRLRGTKTFFTGLPACSLVFLTAADEAGRLLGFLLRRPAEGLRIVSPWSAAGMRATGSHTVALDDLFVPSRAAIAPPGELSPIFMRAAHWSWASFAAVFVGIGDAALDLVVADLRTRTITGVDGPLARQPGVQRRVADMQIKLAAARAYLESAARSVADGARDPLAHYVDMGLIKITACRLAHEVVTGALELAGGRGYTAASPIQRMYRDVAAGLLIPPVVDATLPAAGRLALERPAPRPRSPQCDGPRAAALALVERAWDRLLAAARARPCPSATLAVVGRVRASLAMMSALSERPPDLATAAITDIFLLEESRRAVERVCAALADLGDDDAGAATLWADVRPGALGPFHVDRAREQIGRVVLGVDAPDRS